MRSLLRHRLWAVPLLAALACAACGGWYLRASGDPDLAFATARDAALAQGRADLAVLSSMDATHPDAALASWLTVTTGPLHDRLAAEGGADLTARAAPGAVLHAVVTDAALTELDARSGSARMIATVTVQVEPGGSGSATGPAEQRKRFEATLSRTAAGWRITDLTTVAVGAA